MWELYEQAVEAIEATTAEFSIPSLWRSMRSGPALLHAIRNAVHDMQAHGLVRCTQRRRGSGCLRWIVVR